MPKPPGPEGNPQQPNLWGLIGIVAWEFLSYPLALALLTRWLAQKWGWPVWTIAIAGFAGFGIGVWRLSVRFGSRK